MKKILTLFLPVAATVALATACHDKGDSGSPDKQSDQELVDNIMMPASPADDISAFFKEYLPESSYSGLWPELDLSDADRYDTVCLKIDSAEDFEKIAPPAAALPSVDFERYTLVIGRHENSAGYRLSGQSIDLEQDSPILNLTYERLVGASPAIQITQFFWGLYPKLPREFIIVNVTLKNKQP